MDIITKHGEALRSYRKGKITIYELVEILDKNVKGVDHELKITDIGQALLDSLKRSMIIVRDAKLKKGRRLGKLDVENRRNLRERYVNYYVEIANVYTVH